MQCVFLSPERAQTSPYCGSSGWKKNILLQILWDKKQRKPEGPNVCSFFMCYMRLMPLFKSGNLQAISYMCPNVGMFCLALYIYIHEEYCGYIIRTRAIISFVSGPFLMEGIVIIMCVYITSGRLTKKIDWMEKRKILSLERVFSSHKKLCNFNVNIHVSACIPGILINAS